jgi:predicted nucleic acid-binding protein
MPTPLTATAEAVGKKSPWVVPPLWRPEFRSALIKYVRAKLISLEDAQAMLKKAEQLMTDRERSPGGAKVLELASKSPASAYDCEYIALAME